MELATKDDDPLIARIFAPLVFQLVHWFFGPELSKFASPSAGSGDTHEIQDNSVTSRFIEVIFTALVNEEKQSLREFAGTCFTEAVNSAIAGRHSQRQSKRERERASSCSLIISPA